MKWQVQKPESRALAWQTKHMQWTRGFAWRPVLNYESRTRYWLCFVWFRGSGRFDAWRIRDRWWEGKVPRCPLDSIPRIIVRQDMKTFEKWEIRGGSWQCPDVKDCPPDQKPSAV